MELAELWLLVAVNSDIKSLDVRLLYCSVHNSKYIIKNHRILMCLHVMYSGENNVCGVTLGPYPHRAS